jgi:RNA polymerase sigma factor (sigma-70 family)
MSEEQQLDIMAFVNANVDLVTKELDSKRVRVLYNMVMSILMRSGIVKGWSTQVSEEYGIDLLALAKRPGFFKLFHIFQAPKRDKPDVVTHYINRGSEKEIQSLLEEHEGVYVNIVNSFGSGRDLGWKEDMLQEARIGAWEAIMTFEEGMGPLHKRVYLLSYRAVVNYMRKMRRWEKDVLFTNIQGATEFEAEAVGKNPEEEFMFKEDLNWAVDTYKTLQQDCNPRETAVLFDSILTDEPKTLRTLAKEWDCSRESIRRDKNRLLKILSTKGQVYDKTI